MISEEEPVAINRNMLFQNIFIKFANQYKIDVCLLIMTQKQTDYAAILESYFSKRMNQVETSLIDLTGKNKILSLMLSERKIIICRNDNLVLNKIKYEPLCGDTAQEFYMPIFAQGNRQNEIVGCLYLGSRKTRHKFSDIIHDAGFIRDLSLISQVYNSTYDSYKAKSSFFTFLHIISEIYKNHSQRINHPYNVAYWCLLIAKELHFDEKSIFELYIAALLHDVGVLLIPKSILEKTGKLTEEEYGAIKRHAVYGCNLTRELKYGIDDLGDLDTIIRHHHERYDGTGYPDGLKADEIPLASRIIAVADAADAMLSDRVFQTALPLEHVIDQFSANRGKQFDPELTDIIIRMITAQKDDINTALGPVSWGTFVVSTKKDCFNFQGNIIKKASGYEFISDKIDLKHTKAFNSSDITDCSVIIERHGRFYEYSAVPGRIGNNRIFIRDVRYKPSEQYFSMYWNLTGEIRENNTPVAKIAVRKIGGNCITYYCLDKVELGLKHVYTMKLRFEDGEIIQIPGNNLRRYETGDYCYYDFEFPNLSENVRDRIFKQLYNRQIEIRQLMWKTSYSDVLCH